MQQIKKLVLAVGVLVLVAGAFVGWYSIAANYDYGALSGIYTLSQNGEKCTLHLRPDQTFTEELNRGGVVQEAQGRWRRYGQAHVSFSGEFLKVAGQELNASGESHGQFDKAMGLFPSLTLAPLPDGPTFHKKLFR
ncbi:MAG TPA: hypothetical protein VGN01_07155 [Acidobacteriaceae bacterium]